MEKHIKNFFNQKISELCTEKTDKTIKIISDIDNQYFDVSYHKLWIISKYLRSMEHFEKENTNPQINIPYRINLFEKLMKNFTIKWNDILDYTVYDFYDLIMSMDYLQLDDVFTEYVADYILDKLNDISADNRTGEKFVIDFILNLEMIKNKTDSYLCNHIMVTRNYDTITTICESVFCKYDAFGHIYDKIKNLPILLLSDAIKIITRIDRLYQLQCNISINYLDIDTFMTQIETSFKYINDYPNDMYTTYLITVLIENIEKIIETYCQYYDMETLEKIRSIILEYVENYDTKENFLDIVNKKNLSVVLDDKLNINVINFNDTYMSNYIPIINIDFTYFTKSMQNNTYEYGYIFCTTMATSTIRLKIKVDFSKKSFTIIFYDKPVRPQGARIHFRLLNKYNDNISYTKTCYVNNTSIEIVVEIQSELWGINQIIFDKIVF